MSALTFASCTANSAESESTPATTAAIAAPTVPSETVAPASDAATTTLANGPVVPDTSLDTTTTAPEVTTTTVAHGLGVVTTTDTGAPVPDEIASTASAIYEAAIRRDYARLGVIIGDRKFKWGFVGDRKPAETWAKDFADGTDDVIPRIITLLETRPGTDDQGRYVWPYLAFKDPATWTTDDEAVAASLGFTPGNIADTKKKGRYLEYRLVIDKDGVWNGFYLGG